MKKILVLTFVVYSISPCFLSSQTYFTPEKRDYIWPIGYGNGGSSNFGGSIIDFNYDPPLVSSDERMLEFSENCAVICDENGQLLLYTNGEAIANSNNDIIENGNNLNDFVLFQYRSRLYQGSLFLNAPDNNNLYYLFHEGEIYVGNNDISAFAVFNLYYSVVDMSLNDGQGAVIEKNKIAIQDTLDYGKITATRHANGRDWWVIVAKRESNAYYTLLLSPEGIEVMPVQYIGDFAHSGVGRACFSPDGTKYARHIGYTLDNGDDIYLYDFDRCSGLLSNPRHQTFEPNRVINGVAFSPNSQFLYLNNAIYVWQYDTEEEDVFNTEDTVAIYDLNNPFDTRFFQPLLAPNDKIYFSGLGTHRHFSVLHNPDEAGIACNYEQNALPIFRANWRTIPNTPYFKLGPLDDSPCDTLGLDNLPPDAVSTPEEQQSHLTCFPNPTHGILNLEMKSHSDGQWELINALGKVVYSQKIEVFDEHFSFDLSHLNAGIYFWIFRNDNGVLDEGKIVLAL